MSGERLLVVGLDDSPGGRRALRWALRHARNTGSAVQVVTADPEMHTHGENSDRRDVAVAQQRLAVETILAELSDPPVVSMEVVDDNPVQALVRAARDADMLVVGTHGRNHLGEMIFGSVSAGCIRHATTAVTVVPLGEPGPLAAELLARNELSEV